MNIVTVIFTAIVLSLIAYFIYRISTDKKNTDTRTIKDTVLMTVKTQEYLIYNKKNLSLKFTKDIQNATKFDINDDLYILLKFKRSKSDYLSESTFSLKKIKDDTYILSNGVFALNFEVDPSDPEYLKVGVVQRGTTPFPDTYFLKAVRVKL
jgi:hypothetical protein